MEGVKDFASKCPACGRRFGVKVDGKTLKRSYHESYDQGEVLARDSRSTVYQTSKSFVAQTKTPVSTEVNDYEYTFHCSHCGHKWSTIRTEQISNSSGGVFS